MPETSRVENKVEKKAFQHELTTRGVKGFIGWQDEISKKESEGKKRDFDNAADAKSKEFAWDITPKFGYSHIPAERWPFPEKELQHGR